MCGLMLGMWTDKFILVPCYQEVAESQQTENRVQNMQLILYCDQLSQMQGVLWD